MSQWYYRLGNKELGPIGPSQILSLIRDGTIKSDTLVRKDDRRWLPASEVGGLWDAAARPGVIFRCPHCGKSMDRPPCHCKHCKRHVDKASGQLVHRDIPRLNDPSNRPDLD